MPQPRAADRIDAFMRILVDEHQTGAHEATTYSCCMECQRDILAGRRRASQAVSLFPMEASR